MELWDAQITFFEMNVKLTVDWKLMYISDIFNKLQYFLVNRLFLLSRIFEYLGHTYKIGIVF